MVEYISREAIIKELKEEIKACDMKFVEDIWINKGLKIALKDIKSQPATDVLPVKHGKWIDVYTWTMFHEFKSSGRGEHFWCSECEQGQKQKSNYCPNCGARMDIIYEDDKIRAIKVTG